MFISAQFWFCTLPNLASLIRGKDKRMLLDLCNVSPVSMETVWNGAMVNLLGRHTYRAVRFESWGLCRLMFSWNPSWNSAIIPTCFQSQVKDASHFFDYSRYSQCCKLITVAGSHCITIRRWYFFHYTLYIYIYII